MNLRTLFSQQIRFLTFRRLDESVATDWQSYLGFGLICTWLAGVGRYWDNPRASLWQLLGLGSVIYVFVLALILWIVVLPLRPQRWSYRNVLLFVTLTSPLAFLYAIPVEQFMPLNQAAAANAWFLGIVAVWRVAFLFNFLKRVAGLGIGTVIVTTLMPLTAIVVTLTALNLEHVVFQIMSGIRPEDRTANDTSYFVVLAIAFYSLFAAPFLLLAYVCCILNARREEPSGANG